MSVPHRYWWLALGAAAIVVAIFLTPAVVADKDPVSVDRQQEATAATKARKAKVTRNRARAKLPAWGFHTSWATYCFDPGTDLTTYVHPTRPCSPGTTRVAPNDLFKRAKQAGASTARLAFTWASVERQPPVDGVHTYDWDRLDEQYAQARANDQVPLLTPFGAPEWARVDGWEDGCPTTTACSYAPAGAHVADWQQFLVALMNRYPDSIAIELWNEPNYDRFFAPEADPALYARLLKAAHRAKRAAGYRQPLLMGGLAPIIGSDKALPDDIFLRKTMKRSKPRFIDGVAVHPYPRRRPLEKSMWSEVRRVKRAMRHSRIAKKPLWFTELGVSSAHTTLRRGGQRNRAVTPSRQGKVLKKLYRSARGKNVSAIYFYNLNEISAEGDYWRAFGVVKPDLGAKPAFCYLRRTIGRRHNACPRNY